MMVSRETRFSSRKSIGIKAAATRRRVCDARVTRLEKALRTLALAARLAETQLRYPISNGDRGRLRADLLAGLQEADLVLPNPELT